jgi:hypothetical protein
VNYFQAKAQNFFKLWITHIEMWITAFIYVDKTVRPLVIKLKKEKFFYEAGLLLIRPLTECIALKKQKIKINYHLNGLHQIRKQPPKLLTHLLLRWILLT